MKKNKGEENEETLCTKMYSKTIFLLKANQEKMN